MCTPIALQNRLELIVIISYYLYLLIYIYIEHTVCTDVCNCVLQYIHIYSYNNYVSI